MEIQKPIFIVGSGRSGSTVLHRILTEHPITAWISILCERYPEKPEWNRLLLRSLDLPLVGSIVKDRFKPSEAYEFWEHYCRGFRRPFRDLMASDVTNRNRAKLRAAFQQIPVKGRDRLLIKITGWPRLGFLNEIFPDAKFVHILRDGRAVANSLLNVDFWWGWRGPENWRMGPLSPELMAIWEQYDRSFVALAGLQWNIFLNAMENAQASVDPERFLLLKYEDLCAEPASALKRVLEFSELPWDPRMATVGREHRLSSRNPKWQQDLTEEQQRILETITSEYLEKYGYLSSREMVTASEGSQHFDSQPLIARGMN